MPRHKRLLWWQFALWVAAVLVQQSVGFAADPAAQGQELIALQREQLSESIDWNPAPERTGSPSALELKPGFPQFPSRDGTRTATKPSLFVEVLSASSNRLPANRQQMHGARQAATASVSRTVIPMADAVLRHSSADAQRRSSAPAGHSALDENWRAGAEANATTVAARPVVPAVTRLTQTTMLKLDTVQAACFGGGFLLCLSCQVAIVLVLLKQRQLQPIQIAPSLLAPVLPTYQQSNPLGNRPTAIADFAADNGLLENTASSIGQKWQLEDDNLRQQEAAIIEELVSKNVNWARELA